MLTKVSLYDAVEMKKWDDFVNFCPNGTPYHLSGWLRTIHETYSFVPLLYVSKNDSGEINGVLPFFTSSCLSSSFF